MGQRIWDGARRRFLTSPACGGGRREAPSGGKLRCETPTPTLPRKRERECSRASLKSLWLKRQCDYA
jgi:hypothetical protein